MHGIMYSTRSSMNAQQGKMETISNNLANLNTVGYKSVKVEFQDLLTESVARRGMPYNGERDSNISHIVGTGVRIGEIRRDNTQGALKETGVKTDIAIDGVGFFKVSLPDGTEAYRRAGDFTIDANGLIVDANGNRLSILDENGNEINVPGSGMEFNDETLIIKQDGTVVMNVDDKESIEIGRIPIYDFVGSQALVSIGRNLYVPGDNAQVTESKDFDLLSGFQEISNVSVEDEFTDMMLTQRAYQINAAGLKTADEMWKLVNELRR